MSGFEFVNNAFDFKGRPSSHLNLGVLHQMLNELIANGGINDVEKGIINAYSNLPGQVIAQKIKAGNYLKINKVDVCHKIPIHSFLVALRAVMNKQLQTQGTYHAQMWQDLEDLYDEVMSGVLANPKSDIVALYNAIIQNNTHLACTLADNIARTFDSSHNNLFFGFAVTNRSIGQSSDMHYNVFAPNVCPPTPRGPGMEARLNTLEQTLGLPLTTGHFVTDSHQVSWEANSGVEGRRSDDEGFIETNR